MEQDCFICARFILEIAKNGYYVDDTVLEAVHNIIDEYISENGYGDNEDEDYGNINY